MSEKTPGARWRRLVSWRRAICGAALVAVAAAVAVVIGLRLGPTSPSYAPPTSSVPTDTQPLSGPIAPLTGLADPSGAVGRRCAVTVKIGNTPEARPQYGVESADVVYEEVVEGGITRLAAVFQSEAPDRVGPVRSVRPIDQSIVWPLRGVFAYSGGTTAEVASIAAAPVTLVDESGAGALMFRDPTRAAPHNLYARVDQLYARCADPPPSPLFTYRPALESPSGDPVSSARVGFASGYAVTWSWEPASNTWKRSIFAGPDLSASGDQLSAANVVIMQVQYPTNPVGAGAEAVLTGHGPVSVLTGGRIVRGTWVRPDHTRPAQLLDAGGQPIPLTPGHTWVELPDLNYPITTTP